MGPMHYWQIVKTMHAEKKESDVQSGTVEFVCFYVPRNALKTQLTTMIQKLLDFITTGTIVLFERIQLRMLLQAPYYNPPSPNKKALDPNALLANLVKTMHAEKKRIRRPIRNSRI